MYEWAHNKTKLHRALAICGSSPTEDCVRFEYEKMGGLVLKAFVPAPAVELVSEASTMMDVVVPEEIKKPKPKKTK